MLVWKVLLGVAIALEFLFVPLYLKAVKPDRSKKTLLLKMICSTLFLCSGLLSAVIAGGADTFAKLILLGLLFAWLGDFFLHITEKQLCLLTGLICFLGANLSYIAAYSQAINAYFPDTKFFDTTEVTVFIIVFGLAAMFFFFQRRQFGKALIPVTLYCGVIILMFLKACSLSIRLALEFGFDAALVCTILLLGASLFVLSDIFLAIKTFFGKKESHKLTALNIITYFAAQHLLAIMILFM